MNATELATLSLTELKSFCTANSIEVVGDKRSKATYISAIETFQAEQTLIEIPAIPNPIEPETLSQLSNELPLMETIEMAETATPSLSPALVVIIPLTLIFLAVMSVAKALIQIAKVQIPIWRSLFHQPINNSIPTTLGCACAIDYFPLESQPA